jgi:sirohydrochlorin ferrochelatase
MQERLLVVAHGTASAAGAATTIRLVEAVAAARPAVPVSLCFLDVATPRLPDVLDERPTVVVPLLLNTGYHVQSDIPAAVAPYPEVHVARHLGPHPLLTDALVDRLGATAVGAASVVLAAAGSSRSEAGAELAEAAVLLGERLDRPVSTVTMGDDLAARFARLPGPIAVATYLLADGQFVTTLRAAARGFGTTAPPLGAHPKLVELVWRRYDDAQRTR